MKLDSRHFGQLQQALLHGFDRDALRMMVRLQLGEDLDAVAGNDDLTTVVFDLITWAERNNRVGDLVNGALAANPGSPELQQLAADYPHWQAQAAASTPAEVLAPLAPPGRGGATWAILAVAGVAVALLAFWLLRPLIFPPSPVEPAPVEPTLPEESPLALAAATAPATGTTGVTPSPAPSPTATPAPTVTFTPPPSATAMPTATATPLPEPPRAPALRIGAGYRAFAEQSRVWTIKSGESLSLDMRRLWSGPVDAPVDCASGVIFLSWQVRDPYPGGEELEIQRVLPRGGGQTEVLGSGARGSATVGYCDELALHNLGLEDYRLEWRYASALPR